MWRSVGFLLSFAVVLEGMTLITYVVILVGGKQKRESGWKILAGLHVLCGAIQCAAMAIIVSFHHQGLKQGVTSMSDGSANMA